MSEVDDSIVGELRVETTGESFGELSDDGGESESDEIATGDLG